MKYAKVIVDISVDSVDRLFSYALPIEAHIGQGFWFRSATEGLRASY